MQRRRFLAGSAALGGLFALGPLAVACGSDEAKASEARADVPRVATSAADIERARGMANAAGLFGWNLYPKLAAANPGNLFFSPFSIVEAMAMVTAGARGQTLTELLSLLAVDKLSDAFHPGMNALDQAVRAKPAVTDKAQAFELSVANSAWAQQGFAFEQAYLEMLAKYYGAGVRLTDFAKEPEKSRIAINAWVEEQTKQRIKDLLPKGSINELTRLVLANAIYFKGDWLAPFEKEATKDGPFTTRAGAQKQLPMMHQAASFAYAKGDGVEALELPYAGNTTSMVVLLPAAGKFDAVAADPGTQFASLVGSLKPARVQLTMPKWEFTSAFSLADAMKALGAKAAFDGNAADFSGIDGKRDLYITDVFHKAFVKVDEKGTEAAAATGVVVGATGAPVDPPVQFTMDRPFLFVIRHRETGAPLFAGHVVE